MEGLRATQAKLAVLHDLGLGYLTLGEATPALSAGMPGVERGPSRMRAL